MQSLHLNDDDDNENRDMTGNRWHKERENQKRKPKDEG
jgi:hypothetical protein